MPPTVSRRSRALSGLCWCARCGGRMSIKTRPNGSPVYRCLKTPGQPNCGGMSIAAGLCSYLEVFPQARLELNGPEVIEQEAGIDELDASDKHLIWSLMGGEQRYETGFADALVEDDAELLKQTIRDLAARGIPARHRSEKVEEYRRNLADIDAAAPPDGPALRRIWPKGEM